MVLTATIAHERLPGASEGWLMTCSDGRKYAVKFFVDGDKTVINEFFCNKIANKLDLPVPDAEQIHIEQGLVDIINNSPRNKKIKAGIHFGTLYLEPSSNLQPENIQKKGVQKIINEDKVAGAIIFDIYVCNGDRSHVNSLVAEVDSTKKEYRYVLMDHSHCFAGTPNWNKETMKTLPIRESGIPWEKGSITSDASFQPYVDILKGLTKQDFQKIVNSMPDEWKINNNEDLSALVEALEKRDVDGILQLVKIKKNEYPNWK